MEILLRFLPDPLGEDLSVKTRGSYLLHKIQLSPVAPYSWMTSHQKLPFSSGMQENWPFPFICTLRAHGPCRNLLWSLLLYIFFKLTNNIWITFQSWNKHSSATVKTIQQFPLEVTKVHLLLKEKECLLPLFSPPNGEHPAGKIPVSGAISFSPLKFFSSKFAFFFSFTVNYLEKLQGFKSWVCVRAWVDIDYLFIHVVSAKEMSCSTSCLKSLLHMDVCDRSSGFITCNCV